MKFLKELFSNQGSNNDELKLKFDKLENNWHVMKEHAIMYIGDELTCKTYINSFS